MDMRPKVSYVPYATFKKEQTADIITFTNFEEGGLISEYCNVTEVVDGSDNSDDDLTLPASIYEA